MSHCTEIKVQTSTSEFTATTGSRRLAESKDIKVQEEKSWHNQDAIDLVLRTMWDDYLSLSNEMVIKMLAQGATAQLKERTDEIQDLKEHSYTSIEEKAHYQHHAERLERELMNFPEFKITIRHLD